jgi:hypothetical protein
MEPQMAKVFISYRNEDAPSDASLIANFIDHELGASTAFIDYKSIPLGIDFEAYLWKTLGQCAAVIVVIGPQWLRQDDEGVRRIDNEEDFIRRELEYALRMPVPIIPVLVRGAQRLSADVLPSSLLPLKRRQYLTLRQRSTDQDLARLVTALREELGPRKRARTRPGPVTVNGPVNGDVVNGDKHVGSVSYGVTPAAGR